MNKTEYYLGLDMGTNSVGWAVTNTEYELLRAKGKDMWGIREFDEAKTAAERRSYRTARRRKQREQVRIGLLRDYFKDEIDKVDPDFFIRMDNSFYHEKDKQASVRYKNVIFNDPEFTDKDYREKYRTVFHLIMDLIENKEPHDVRLVYLAILNIFKHRGHFLNESLSTEDVNIDVRELYVQFRNAVADETANEEADYKGVSFPETIDYNHFDEIMCDMHKSRSVKAALLSELLNVTKKDKQATEFIRALCGLKTDARKLFNLDAEEKIEVDFSDVSYEEKVMELESSLEEVQYDIISIMKQIYDACAWNSIIKGFDYLSQSRIASYEKHNSDLKKLKKVIRENCSEDIYNHMFRTDEKGTYGDYVGSNNSGKKTRRNGEHKRDDFYKEVLRILEKLPDSDDTDSIKQDIAAGTYMPKQLTDSNGVIPYQAHYKELRAILNNAEKYLPFLKEKTEDCDLNVSEQILSIFSFKIPYYIGPITSESEKNGGTGWVVRKAEGRVLPWNINEKIDIKGTNEQFIQRLVRRCTYISGESVLPKASLLYEKYMVLNKINTIAIDGERIPVQLKQDIYNELFLSGKPVSRNMIVKYLYARNLLETADQLTGIDDMEKCSLANYAKFVNVFGQDAMKLDSYRDMVESIIFFCTVYGDSKKYLVERLKESFSDQLSEAQIKRIKGFSFKDWGKFSKEFLLLKGVDKETGEVLTLIDAMWNYQMNMMELINSDQFTFAEELKAKTTQSLSALEDISIDELDEMGFSAPVKRMVWQTVLLVREIKEIMGHEPNRVFIETTRSDGEKGRHTVSRKDKFLDLYKNVKDEMHDWQDIIVKAESDGTIRSKKMYLYLMQKGKDMYTGQPISLDALFDDNLYDIDHIYPQSFVKDDNLDNNMVLVNKSSNNHKQDKYPLEESIRKACMPLWLDLRQNGFMNEEKYKRLTGNTEFTDEQLEGFIARQIVETGQATKGITRILEQLLPESKVVYSKAKNVSDFRQKFSLPKSRLINDFHHANDAYLNIVVGNAYYAKFTDNPRNFIAKQHQMNKSDRNYHMGKFFEYDVKGAWKGCGKQLEDGSFPQKGTIITVKKMLKKNTPILTRMNYVNHGGITKQTRHSAEEARKGSGYLPFKTSDSRLDIREYGGFSDVSTAYFFLVESDEKNKRVRTLETVPVYLADRIEKEPGLLEEYCIKSLGLINPSIRVRKIKVQSLIKKDGYFIHVTGKTVDRLTLRNATSICLDTSFVDYIKKIENYTVKNYLDEGVSKEENCRLYLELVDKHISGIYKNRPNPVGLKLKDGYEVFCKLDLEKQVQVLIQILNMSAIVASGKGDLKLLQLSQATGVMLIPKKISGMKECVLINQSITGLKEQRVDLLTV